MDPTRLERLAKALTPGPLSRRSALRRLGRGGLAASLVGGAGLAQPRLVAGQDAGQATGQTDPSLDTDRRGDAGEAPASSEALVVPPAERDDLVAGDDGPAGRLRRLTDGDRGLWLDTGDGWVGLGREVFDVRAFGAVGDGTTDDWGAFHAAIDAMTSPFDPDANSPYGRTLFVPPGRYRLSQTLLLDRAVRLVGAGADGSFTDSVLLPDPGLHGIVVAAADPPFTGRPGRRGDGSVIERLRIEPGANPDAADGAATSPTALQPAAATASPDRIVVADDLVPVHGVWLRTRATLHHVHVAGFGGDGIHVEADAAAPGTTDATGWRVDGCRVAACGEHGLAALGEGANAGVALGLTVVDNRKWGVFDDSSRGNTYLQCVAARNAQGPYTSAGGDNRSLFAGCAADDGQPRSTFSDATIVVAGDHRPGFQGGNAWTAAEARMYLRAQSPDAEPPLSTVPTLRLQQSAGQTEPHLRIDDRGDGRLLEFTADGRLLVGPAALLRALGGDAPNLAPVQAQISADRNGEAALRWVLAADDDAAVWAGQARAFLDATATGDQVVQGDQVLEGDAPAVGGYAGARLTFQTPDAVGRELDTLTLRQGRVGVGTVAPAPAAAVEIASATQGFLPPRLTDQQRDAIVAPPEGLLIYNLTSKRLNFHDGDAWREAAVPPAGG